MKELFDPVESQDMSERESAPACVCVSMSACTHACTHTHTTHTHTHLTNTKQHTKQFLLQTLHMLLCNLCIRHGLKKYSPGGRLEASAISPLDQSFLHCFLLIMWMPIDEFCYFACIQSHSFQNRSLIASSFPAHKCSEEYQVVWAVCRESKAVHKHISHR